LKAVIYGGNYVKINISNGYPKVVARVVKQEIHHCTKLNNFLRHKMYAESIFKCRILYEKYVPDYIEYTTKI